MRLQKGTCSKVSPRTPSRLLLHHWPPSRVPLCFAARSARHGLCKALYAGKTWWHRYCQAQEESFWHLFTMALSWNYTHQWLPWGPTTTSKHLQTISPTTSNTLYFAVSILADFPAHGLTHLQKSQSTVTDDLAVLWGLATKMLCPLYHPPTSH